MVNRTLQILPSIFAADVSKMESEIEKIKQHDIKMIHYDVMDNHFVPNISFGPLFIQQIIQSTPNIQADIHLMIDLPGHWETYLDLNPSVLTVHLEAGNPILIKSILQQIRSKNILAGISIKPTTPITVLKEFLGEFDLLLIMSVEPGFSFQSFIPESVIKIQEARKLCGDNIIIQADGGISQKNMLELKNAGLDWFVMGGGFFKEANIHSMCQSLLSE